VATRKKVLACSFCGGEDEYLMEGITIGRKKNHICLRCVVNCNKAVEAEFGKKIEDVINEQKILTLDYSLCPKQMISYLDQFVIGQEQTKKILSVAVVNHYKRLFNKKESFKDVKIEKSNVLLVGPTGCGKTYLLQKISTLLNVPFAICDATSITEAGYIGDDIENVLYRLIQNADGNIERAQQGIVYIDEVDKLAKKTDSSSRDIKGEGVQQGLLKIMEGTIANVPIGNSKRISEQIVEMDTSDILFVCGGAFVGIDKIIGKRIKGITNNIGFQNPCETAVNLRQKSDKILAEDVIKYGMIPEFIGRLPIISSLSELSLDDFVKILRESKNNLIQQFKKIFDFDNCTLEFTEEALYEIAKKAKEIQIGARGLRSVFEDVMINIMTELSMNKGCHYIVTKEVVNGEKAVPIQKTAKLAVG
jgi:ATP-dependent Clp protease ATP-binding subunit ClpX